MAHQSEEERPTQGQGSKVGKQPILNNSSKLANRFHLSEEARQIQARAAKASARRCSTISVSQQLPSINRKKPLRITLHHRESTQSRRKLSKLFSSANSAYWNQVAPIGRKDGLSLPIPQLTHSKPITTLQTIKRKPSAFPLRGKTLLSG